MFEAAAGTRLLHASLPFRIDPPGAKEAVLLLHGFTGQPWELSDVGKLLAGSGFAVYAPRYPGHGTRRVDFLATRAEDWARRAIDAYLELRADYRTVHVLGHSMGGLIATGVAASFDCPRLILFAPAFLPLNKAMKWAPYVAPFKPVIKRGRIPDPGEKNPVRLDQLREYSSDDLVAPAAQLHRLVVKCGKMLPSVKSKILVIAGEKDEAVSPDVGNFVKTKAVSAASVEGIVLKGAGHLFPFDERAAESSALVREWMLAGEAEGRIGGAWDSLKASYWRP
jgi:carboxylesterase